MGGNGALCRAQLIQEDNLVVLRSQLGQSLLSLECLLVYLGLLRGRHYLGSLDLLSFDPMITVDLSESINGESHLRESSMEMSTPLLLRITDPFFQGGVSYQEIDLILRKLLFSGCCFSEGLSFASSA